MLIYHWFFSSNYVKVRGQISVWEPSLSIHDVVIIRVFALEITPMNTVARGTLSVYNTELNAINSALYFTVIITML
jgi:hypothetical protein